MVNFFQSDFFHTIATQLFLESFFQVRCAFAWEPTLHGLWFGGRCDFIFIGVELDGCFFWGEAFALERGGILFGMW